MARFQSCSSAQMMFPAQAQPSADMADDADKAALRREIQALRRRIDELEQLADTDPMTALANRRALEREMGRALASVARHDMPYAFALLDVDALKRVNDDHGHLAGDAVLRRLAHGLRMRFRRSDLAARLGGDEFALILSRVSIDEAQARLTAFMAEFSRQEIASGPTRLRVSFSVGLTRILPCDTLAQVVSRADAALYRAKAAQRSAR